MVDPSLSAPVASARRRERSRRRLTVEIKRVDRLTSSPHAVVAVVVAVVLAVALLVIDGFPDRWVAAFSCVTGAVTVSMTFVIQHAQSRQQVATQLKLDELIRALPEPDDRAAHLENADEVELEEREREAARHHASNRRPRSRRPQ
ncbi:low affinity iron permease family protein [Aquihabitans sp. McL0605]|uniref:low affinity iron permease family protein n=1 Tax=Aquihabitans sp. McL0605 TaxID=3415671 RepID=UPI003CE8C850